MRRIAAAETLQSEKSKNAERGLGCNSSSENFKGSLGKLVMCRQLEKPAWILAAMLLLLPACVSRGSGPYLMVTDSADGALVWRRFRTLEACERESQRNDLHPRCALERDLRGRLRLIE